MRARYQCKIKRRYIVTGRMRKTELDGPSEVGTEKELIAQRTEMTLEIMEKTLERTERTVEGQE